jgi:hypothetical protein
MVVYISQSVHREPSDQADLRNGVDAILVSGGGTFSKQADSEAHRFNASAAARL